MRKGLEEGGRSAARGRGKYSERRFWEEEGKGNANEGGANTVSVVV